MLNPSNAVRWWAKPTRMGPTSISNTFQFWGWSPMWEGRKFPNALNWREASEKSHSGKQARTSQWPWGPRGLWIWVCTEHMGPELVTSPKPTPLLKARSPRSVKKGEESRSMSRQKVERRIQGKLEPQACTHMGWGLRVRFPGGWEPPAKKWT